MKRCSICLPGLTIPLIVLIAGLPVISTGQSKISAKELPLSAVVAQADTTGGTLDRQGATPGTKYDPDEPTTDEIFGQPGGHLHPYLSLKGEWTDNLFNLDADETNNLLTVVSPGIWVGFPSMKQIPVSLTPHNTAIGGMRFSDPGSSSYDRFQAYLLGGLDYKNYSEDSDLNYTAWRIEGLFQYNLPAGISFRISDRFSYDRDRYDIGSFLPEDFTVVDGTIYQTSLPSRIRDYYSNQANIAVKIDMSEKFSLLLDYVNFYLDYDEEENAWLDRSDNRYSCSINYTYSPKTSFFVEYDFADIRYDTDTRNNSSNNFYYGGLTWKGTAKTSLMAKGGYQVKEYDNNENNLNKSNDTFVMEMDFIYLLTDKTKITAGLYKALEETDSVLSNGKDTLVAKVRYNQNFSQRIQGIIEFWYEISDYENFNRTESSDIFENRRDDRYLVRPAVQYIIRDWLMAELAYSFENRVSTESLFNYTTNTLSLRLSGTF